MPGWIKNLFKLYSNKKALLFFLGLVLFLGLVPLYSAQASFWDGFVNVLTNLGSTILDAFLSPLALITKAIAIVLLEAMESLIKFFMSFPISPNNEYTPFAIVKGWEISRDLVNIIFILILAFIGLATILRLQTYQIKKTLPSLIIIALLVNFSGVLVGLIVDIGNILTFIFLNATSKINASFTVGDIPVFSAIPGGDGALAQDIVQIIYYIVSILIYFFMIFVFAIRVLVLWVLVILSPLAFGAYILPSTKRFWNQWLQTLIQWSIVGIPISFALFLSKMIMNSQIVQGAWWQDFTANHSALTGLFVPFTSLFILFAGIAISMQMAPAGARGVINLGKKVGIGNALKATRRLATIPRVEKAIEKASKLESLTGGRYGKTLLGKSAAGKMMGKIVSAPMKWEIRKIGQKGVDIQAAIPGLIEKEMKDENLQKLIQTKKFDELAERYKDPFASRERKIAIATLLALAKGEKGLKKLGKHKIEALKLAGQISQRHMETLISADPSLTQEKFAWSKIIDPTDKKDREDMDIIRADLGFTRSIKEIVEAGKEDREYEIIAKKLAMRNIAKGTNDEQMGNWSQSVLSDPEIQEAVILTKGPQFIGRIAEKHGLEYANNLEQKRQEIASTQKGQLLLARKNPGMFTASLIGANRYFFDHLKDPETGKNFDLETAKEFIRRARISQEHKTIEITSQDLKTGGEIRRASRELGEVRRKRSQLESNLKTLNQRKQELQRQVQDIPMNEWPGDIKKSLGETDLEIEETKIKIQPEIDTLTNEENRLLAEIPTIALDDIESENLSLIEKEITKTDNNIKSLRDRISKLQKQIQLFPNLPGERNKLREENMKSLDDELRINENTSTILKMRVRQIRAISMPSPMPQIEKGMDKDTKNLIKSGNKLIDKVKDLSDEIKNIMATVSNNKKSRAISTDELKKMDEEFNALTAKIQANAASEKEREIYPELENAIKDLNDSVKNQDEAIRENEEKIDSIIKTILDKKTDLENARESLTPLIEDFEEKKEFKNIDKKKKK